MLGNAVPNAQAFCRERAGTCCENQQCSGGGVGGLHTRAYDLPDGVARSAGVRLPAAIPRWPAMFPHILAALTVAALAVAPSLTAAQAPSFAIDEIYSNADGSVQYVVLRETQGLNAQIAFRVATTAARAGTHTLA